VIVNVEAATTPDDNMLIHKSLEARDLLPTEHLVDKGYTDAGVLIDSQRDYAVAVIGPVTRVGRPVPMQGSTNRTSWSTGIGSG